LADPSSDRDSYYATELKLDAIHITHSPTFSRAIKESRKFFAPIHSTVRSTVFDSKFIANHVSAALGGSFIISYNGI
jgi:hypothetical protein